jgi:hypothetical protein
MWTTNLNINTVRIPQFIKLFANTVSAKINGPDLILKADIKGMLRE